MEQKKFGFGCMRLPVLDKEDATSIDMEQFKEMVDLFLENGFTYFDTAYMYHNYQSEIAVREALVKRHPRESFALATKLPTMQLKTEEDQIRIFDEQLEKCGVDYFDYYLLHCLNQENYATVERLGSFAFLQKKKEEGKIRTMGFSFHDTAELLDEILTKHPETEFVQLQLNYLDWDSENVQSRKCYEVCVKHQKPVFVMEPVKGGTLALVPKAAKKLFEDYAPEASVASWALRFAASQPAVAMVLSGMSDMSQLKDNLASMGDFHPLQQEEKEIIQQVVEIINNSIAIPCTGCQYCVEGCPQEIAIPKYFELYNKYKQLDGQLDVLPMYKSYEGKNGLAGDCLECGQCEEHCPQHLSIISFLKKVSEAFD